MKFYELRKSRNLTQKQIAKELNLGITTYCGYENKTREANYETLIKIADYFHVSIDYLLDHKTNFLNLDELTLIQRDVVKTFLKLDLDNQNKIYGFIMALYNEQK